ncbi:hypothetical protein MT325_m262L [Paramecium bursaria chlorella virus MT325]|uniref:Uncharacterized protein m262L n=1 Tax=Paramecium bursaria Chlorella virus MT325 TaxID=346932 RepID=A7ITZ2_PBCVM|nr:hypothetical protein MT325_m262L [Paramecium bursaria chlorella virus MT325]
MTKLASAVHIIPPCVASFPLTLMYASPFLWPMSFNLRPIFKLFQSPSLIFLKSSTMCPRPQRSSLAIAPVCDVLLLK